MFQSKPGGNKIFSFLEDCSEGYLESSIVILSQKSDSIFHIQPVASVETLPLGGDVNVGEGGVLPGVVHEVSVGGQVASGYVEIST